MQTIQTSSLCVSVCTKDPNSVSLYVCACCRKLHFGAVSGEGGPDVMCSDPGQKPRPYRTAAPGVSQPGRADHFVKPRLGPPLSLLPTYDFATRCVFEKHSEPSNSVYDMNCTRKRNRVIGKSLTWRQFALQVCETIYSPMV